MPDNNVMYMSNYYDNYWLEMKFIKVNIKKNTIHDKSATTCHL